MHASKLSIRSEDIERLVSHPKRDVRAAVAQKICREIKDKALSVREQEITRRILQLIIKDAASMVRRALAITLKNSPNLPPDIARQLIRDVDSIATPVLTHSPVLTDEDLLEILRSKAAAKMMAISKRNVLNTDMVSAIIRYGDSRVVASVAANDGAQIDAQMGAHMLDKFHDNDLVKEGFIARRDLPPLLVEKLITMVSAQTARRLHEKHEVPLEIAIDIARNTCERASVDFVAQSWLSRDMAAFVSRLAREDRLTSSLIIRAACCGQMRFVEYALAERADISLGKAALMVHDSGPFGLKALCKRAELTEMQFVILRASVVIYRDFEMKGHMRSKAEYQNLMLERILTLPLTFEDADREYLFERLDKREQEPIEPVDLPVGF